MVKKSTKKYLESIAWFTALWGIKEFILEPLYKKSKYESKENKIKRKPIKIQQSKGCLRLKK